MYIQPLRPMHFDKLLERAYINVITRELAVYFFISESVNTPTAGKPVQAAPRRLRQVHCRSDVCSMQTSHLSPAGQRCCTAYDDGDGGCSNHRIKHRLIVCEGHFSFMQIYTYGSKQTVDSGKDTITRQACIFSAGSRRFYL